MDVSESRDPGLVDDGTSGLTYRIIGIAMEVHNDLGPGHRESAYHNAMTQRFIEANLAVEYEPELPVFDEHGNQVHFYAPDHRVEHCVLIEYKAHTHPLTSDEIAQCIDYLAASDHKLVLLFNFGRSRLEWRRIFPPGRIALHRRKRRSGGFSRW
ncbi:MAG: GxxExxY protein [Roseiflexaceae bacterium]|nr:GxxExxY protein [Roseiflexaceae bacterium]